MVVRAGRDDHELVLRRWARPEWKSEDPSFTAQREAAVLELLERVPVPTPRLVAVDPDGTICDVPAIVTDKLPGGPPGERCDLGSFTEQLAAVLPAIHALNGEDARQLPAYERYHDDLGSAVPPAWAGRPELWEQAVAVAAGPVAADRACLIHRDYHPGNTLWSGARLTGVVDWTQASWGPPAVDTGHMRWNLAVAYGAEAAERFLEHYGEIAPGVPRDQRYWDVVTLLDVLPDLDPGDLPRGWELRRLEEHLQSVLDR